MNLFNQNINDIGLKLLSWVKKVKGSAVDLQGIEVEETALVDHKIWSDLLGRNVSQTGRVNYKGFIEEKTQFEVSLKKLSENPPGKNWSDKEKIAYWINTYNAFTVKLIVDHYPLKSIKDIGDGLPMINSPWDIKFFKIGKTDFDLNTIEHDILRKQFEEPRIHFAINCASFSCPKLRNEAFTGTALDQQLKEQTHSFINNPDKNQISKNETKISKIFSWFESDFLKKEDSIKSFLQPYHESFDEKNDIEYLEYRWDLNE